jgi:hypothetical protein
MEFQQLLMEIFERASQTLEKALDGLTQNELNYLPKTDCNSIAWLTWHLTRVQDSAISDLKGSEQCWITQKWYSKFSRDPDPNDRGIGHTSEDVSNFKSPDSKTLLEYYHAVFKHTKDYLRGLSTDELGRKIDNPTSPLVGLRIAAITSDNLQHIGQVAYLRGMLREKGWYGV